MDLESIKHAYRRYARYYDRLFGPIFSSGRRMAVQRANHEHGQRVLEVGVGTGLSLPEYREGTFVVGVDISRDMLAIARQRIQEADSRSPRALLEMDAQRLAFADNSFDSVVAMYVASVVPEPERLMREMQRVCRPGGTIIIINHFASQHWLLQRLEQALRPLSRYLGFRPDMALDDLPKLPGLERVEVCKANLFGYWKLVHYRNGAVPHAGTESERWVTANEH